MLIDRKASALICIDVQARLAPSIHEHEQVIASGAWLIEVASHLGIPVHATEQYPEGLGSTVGALRTRLNPSRIHQKMHFSWMQTGRARSLRDQATQWVIFGTEAHVCVQQTVLEAAGAGLDVFVVDEATGSRRPLDKRRALERMRAAGATIVTREMVAFEWLRRADTDLFKTVQPLLRDGLSHPAVASQAPSLSRQEL